MPLTNLEIKNAQPQDKEYTLLDGAGLMLLVKPSGSKLWRYRYAINGKTHKLSLGSYPEVTLQDARIKAANARIQRAQGLSPIMERQKEKRASKLSTSFEGVSLEWQASRKPQWSEAYATNVRRLFERNVFPVIGERPIADIEPLELLAMLKQVEKRGSNSVAEKVRCRCGEVYSFAIVTGRAKYNPARDLATAMQRFQRGHFRSLDETDIPGFIDAINRTSGSIIIVMAIKLMMLTGLRPGEIRAGEWKEINLGDALWEIPAERMKGRRPHVVPLSQQAVELLRSVKAITGKYSYIFPHRSDITRPMSKMSMNSYIHRSGYGEKLTGHGFRHMMSTILHEKGYNSAWIELQLAHVDRNAIRGTYNRAQYLEGRREMLQWYADHISQLTECSKSHG